MIVLANRPGFPFMGNDFYRECGDLFSWYSLQYSLFNTHSLNTYLFNILFVALIFHLSHGITPPYQASEVKLVEKYAPSLRKSTVEKLVSAFSSLRHLVEVGILSYPYSTRHVTYNNNVVKNLTND